MGHPTAAHRQDAGRGGEGERERGAVPYLPVRGHRVGHRGRQDDGGDQLAGQEPVLLVRPVAGQPVQVGDGEGADALRTDGLHVGIECDEGDREVRGVCRDAVLGGAQYRQVAVHSLARGAAAARTAFVAGLGDVLEVQAPGALQQVAGGGRPVAELSGRAGEQRLAEYRVRLADQRVRREVGIGDEGADTQAAVGCRRHVTERQPTQVDEQVRLLDTELHEVDEVGAAGQEPGAGAAGEQPHGILRVAGPQVGELLHRVASRTARTMWG